MPPAKSGHCLRTDYKESRGGMWHGKLFGKIELCLYLSSSVFFKQRRGLRRLFLSGVFLLQNKICVAGSATD